MEYDVEIEDPRLDLARQLVEQLEVNNEEKVNYLLSELTQIRHDSLFCEVAKLTRELHEMLNNFSRDSRISSLAEYDIPDAKKRLSHVIDMNEESALRTLQAVERSVPLSQAVRKRMAHFKKSWQSFRRREMTPNEFRHLNQDMDVFLEKTDDEISQIHGHLSEILLAQETQDLSGQVICQVIELVQNVENSLVDLIRLSGQVEMGPVKQAAEMHNSKGSGSVTPAVDTENIIQSQDEVDDLLSSLGF